MVWLVLADDQRPKARPEPNGEGTKDEEQC